MKPSTLICAMCLAVALCATNANAANPSITSLNTPTLQHGGSVTISGTNFGTKSTAAPLIWESFDDGQVDSSVSALGVSLATDAQRGVSVQNMKGNFQNAWYQCLGTSQTATTWYVMLWWRLDPNWVWGTGSGQPALGNIKFFRVYPDAAIYCNYVMAWHTFGGANSSVELTEGAVGGSYFNYYPRTDVSLGAWHSHEWAYQENTAVDAADGKIRFWFDSGLRKTRDDIVTATNEYTDRTKYILIAGFFNSWGFPSVPQYVWLDDLYIDTTWARVMIGDAQTWEQCTHREVQIPSAWSDTSITVTANQGSFANGATVYMYVVDSSGNYCYPGYAIQVGTGGPTDVTPPSVTGRSPAPGATGVAVDSNIVLHVVDGGDGVDQSTIVFKLDDVTKTPTITGTAADYTVTYDPPTDLDADTEYTVSVDASDAHTPANAMSTVTYTFTTEAAPASDTVAPYIASEDPTPGETGVAIDKTISVHVLDAGDGVDQTTIVFKLNGSIKTPVITGTAADYTVTYNPPSDLDAGTQYTVTITASDLAGTPNAMSAQSWSFVTAAPSDTIPPYVPELSLSPARGAVEVAITTAISFHVKDSGDGVDNTTIVLQLDDVAKTPDSVTGTSADYTVTYDPPGDLTANTTYNVKVDASDLAGGAGSWTVDSLAYTRRKKLTVDSTKIDSDLTNLPVLVVLTASNFTFANANADGFDIRFTASDGTTLLKYERERHDNVGELAEYWVKLPEVDDTINTEFYLYYRTTDTADGADAANVWDTNYKVVHHLSDLTTSTTNDSTTNNNDGTKKGANEPIEETTLVKAYASQKFDGTNDYYSVTSGASTTLSTAGTLSAWVRFDTNLPDGNDRIVVNGQSNSFWLGINPTGTRYIVAYLYDGAEKTMVSTTSAVADTWYYVAGTFDSTTLTVYVNGAAQGNRAASGINYETGDKRVVVGAYGGADGGWLKGYVDELRVCNDARSAAEIKADYNASANTLLTYGSEETATAGANVMTQVEWTFTTAGSAPAGDRMNTITNVGVDYYPAILGVDEGDGGTIGEYHFARWLVLYNSGAFQYPTTPAIAVYPRLISPGNGEWIPMMVGIDSDDLATWEASANVKKANIVANLFSQAYEAVITAYSNYILWRDSTTKRLYWEAR